MSKFTIPKLLPGQSSAADALIGAAGAAAAPDPPTFPSATAPTTPLTKGTPRPFMLRLPPPLAAKIEAAHAVAMHAEYTGRHDMLLKMLDRALDEYLARKGVHRP